MYSNFIHIIFISALLASCGGGQPCGNDHEEHRAEEERRHSPDEIVVTKERAAALGIRAEEIQAGAFAMTIRAGGQIQAAQGDEQIIVAPASGVVSFAKPLTEGSRTEKGETLLRISARNITDGDPAEKARLVYETAEKSYTRAKELASRQLISQNELEQTQFNYRTAKVAYDAVSSGSTGNGMRVTSPTGGYIMRRMVNEGEYVAVGQPLLGVIRNRQLYLKADVPEKYYAQLPAVVTAHFKMPYDSEVYRLTDLNGRLLSYGRAADASSVYVPVLFEFDNTGRFAPGAFVDVFLITGDMPDVITLPLNAVIEEQGLHFVFRQTDDDAYKKQEVKIGDDNGRQVRILSGVNPGDRIVTQGALQVKLSFNSSAMPEHSH
ncbi:MAG: efflux RND transporter periplasmic adaptor subunit [Bacteroidales bacterium]|jgi:RND family efflux transporter MFP subunit|nr:efflux RND transporter periplasmic adaptor subunit [Bacteroidales bacterium]